MDVPPADDPVWRRILTDGVRYQLDFLAAKILLGWLLLKVDSDPSEPMIADCTQTLHHLFAQNARLPCVQHDLLEILGPGDGGMPSAAGGTDDPAAQRPRTPQTVKEASE